MAVQGQEMLQRVWELIKKEDLMRAGELVVAGVSGGADSICLLSVLLELRARLGIRLAAVHVHHGIRGAEADRDADYVRTFCEARNVPCRVFYRDVPALAAREGLSEEEAGRKARYGCFLEALEEWQADRIAVAHNRDDNAETVLFHLFRGSGLRGLSGMAPKGPLPVGAKGAQTRADILVRPLLSISRAEIEAYLCGKQVDFCQDSTNESEVYSRNRIRRQILPQAALVNEAAAAHIVSVAEMIGSLDRWLEQSAADWISKYCSRGADGTFRIPAGALSELETVLSGCVIRQILRTLTGSLKDVTKCHTDSVLALAGKQPGRVLCLPGGVEARTGYGVLQVGFRQKRAADSGEVQVLEPDEEIRQTEIFGRHFTYRKFLRSGGEKIPENRCTKWFDYDKIKTSLCLRGRKPGDYFQAFLNGGRQTVKSYMINEKIPSGERNRIPLLADADHVLWIVGGRISEAYKVTEETRQILEISVSGD